MARRSARASISRSATAARPPPPSQTRAPTKATPSRSTSPASSPAGLSINSHTGVISGTPTNSDYTSNAHAFNFNFTSFDGTFAVTGQINTASSLDAVGGYDVTGIAGSVVGHNGGTISTLIRNPTPSSEW